MLMEVMFLKKFNLYFRGFYMKNLSLKFGVFMFFFMSRFAYASSSSTSDPMPWETMVDKFAKSLGVLGMTLGVIGIIWAGYSFMIANEKEAGFKKLVTTLIGGTIIFGAKAILTSMVGAHF